MYILSTAESDSDDTVGSDSTVFDLPEPYGMTCIHNISRMYPKELELKKTTESIDRCSYLDISITIANHKFRTDLYDKR